MARKVLTVDRFKGGQSSDIKEGPADSFWFSKHFDIRKSPSKLTVLPRTVQQSFGFTDLPIDMVQVTNGNIYILGHKGNIYLRLPNGSISLFGNIPPSTDVVSYGMLYRSDVDAIYITGQKALHEVSPIIYGTPQLRINKYGPSKSADPGATATGGAQTYTVPTTLIEAGPLATDPTHVNARFFISDIEPLYSVKVKIPAKGTGDWTLTLHDALNTVLGTATLVNSAITIGQLNEFVFATPIRMLVKPGGRTYHFHLTSTATGGTAQTSVASDLSTADYEIWASRFVPTRNGFHPMGQFLQYNMIGNGRYLSQWEPLTDTPSNLEYLRHKLTLPDGYEMTSMQQWQQYYAMGAEKRTTNGMFQDGKIFLWDGTAATYNDYVNVPQGSPYSLYTDEAGILNFYAAGAHYQYNGGNQATKIRNFRNTDSEYSQAQDITIVYPNMMTTRRTILLMGYPSQSTNPKLDHAIYSYGNVDVNYPKIFGYNYSISTLTNKITATNNLRIGCIKNIGDTLFIGWRDDGDGTAGEKYGLDVVDNFSTPYSFALLESIIFDNAKPHKVKEAYALKVQIPVLPTGSKVRIGYKINRTGSFVFSDYQTAAGELFFGFGKKSFREIQFALECTNPIDGTVTVSPEITSFSFDFDDMEEDKRFK